MELLERLFHAHTHARTSKDAGMYNAADTVCDVIPKFGSGLTSVPWAVRGSPFTSPSFWLLTVTIPRKRPWVKGLTPAEVALQRAGSGRNVLSPSIFSSWVMPLVHPVDSGGMSQFPVHLILAGSDCPGCWSGVPSSTHALASGSCLVSRTNGWPFIEGWRDGRV